MIDEGAIKFHAAHRPVPLDRRSHGEVACRLIAWREILARTGLVGRDPELYGGFGYGNVSARVGPPSLPRRRRRFLITGTQTSGKACMSLADFCVVEACDPERNRVVAHPAGVGDDVHHHRDLEDRARIFSAIGRIKGKTR